MINAALALLSIAAKPQIENLDELSKAIQGKQIVEIGEATHGGAEFYSAKIEIVRELHKNSGYNVLVLESGMMEVALAMRQRQQLSAEKLMNATVFGNFRWAEMLPLYEFIKQNPRLEVVGCDVQFSSDDVTTLVPNLIRPYDVGLADELAKRLGEGYSYMGLREKPTEFIAKRDAYISWLKSVEQRLAKIKASRQDSQAFGVVRSGVKSLIKFWNIDPAQPIFDNIVVRDRIMADLVKQQIGQKKAMIWAHNGHIGKGLGYTTLGDHLRESYKGRVYALGLFAKAGTYYQHWTNTVQSWDAAPTGLESTAAINRFIASRTLIKEVTAFEPENGGQITFNPQERLDGVIVLPKVSPPSRIKH